MARNKIICVEKLKIPRKKRKTKEMQKPQSIKNTYFAREIAFKNYNVEFLFSVHEFRTISIKRKSLHRFYTANS